MPKWPSPAMLLLIALSAVEVCAAQDNRVPDADPSTESSPAVSIPVPQPEQTSGHSAPTSEWGILRNQWKRTVPDMLHDQKQIWLFPVSVVRGHHLRPTFALLGATALLTAIDVHDAKWARNNIQPLGGFNNAFSGYNTATATEAFASAFYLAAIARRNAYDQQTFILAGEAVLDSEILTTIMKDADGREAPISYPTGGNFADSWFKVRSGGWLGGWGSMPSGHSIAITAVATVFADRYPHPAWHQWLAYGLAAAAGVSRVSLQSHFTSDTFAGGALGYVIARYVVLARQTSK